MNDKDEINVYLSMLLMKNEDLKNIFKEAGKFPEEDLDDIVSLFRKISDEKEMMKLVKLLVDNCNGAVEPVFMLMQPPFVGDLLYLIKNNIKGVEIYSLWNDCAKRDGRKFLLQLWALESGVYTQNEIDENFKINHLTEDPKSRWENIEQYKKAEEDDKWLIKNNRLMVLPFIFDEEKISPKDYMQDPTKVTSPYDKGFKKYVMANRTYQRLYRFLQISRLTANNLNPIVSKSPNEIEVTISMPVRKNLEFEDSINGQTFNFDYYKQEKEFEPVRFVVNTQQILEVLDGNPKKFFDKMRFDTQVGLDGDYVKTTYFLRYARKQFLPSLAVIRSFPIEIVQNFYLNNNDKRFGEIMKKSEFVNFEHQEGLVKLCHLLGLFSEKGYESELAHDFILQNIIGKVDGNTLHKLYGAIEIKPKFKRDFAKFFMINYLNNSHCFEDEKGVDFTAKIYANFEKILAFRPEKEIDTTTERKRLTPKIAISVFDDAVFKFDLPKEYQEKMDKIEGFKEVVKYGTSKEEIIFALDSLEAAKKITEDEIKFAYFDDIATSKTRFRILRKGEPEIIYTGKKSNCCFHFGGASKWSWEHAIQNPNSSVVVFESDKGYTQGWFYYDDESQIFFIDNLEGRIDGNAHNKSYANDFVNAVLRFADKMLIEINKKGIPCIEIRIGKDFPNAVNESFYEALKYGQMIDLQEPNLEYVQSRGLYTDAWRGQYIISNEELFNNRKYLKADISSEESEKQPN